MTAQESQKSDTKSDTMLLLCDYQNGILAMQGLADGGAGLVATANRAADLARGKNIPVGFVRVAFRAGHPEVCERNRLFKLVKQHNMLVDGTEGAALHSDLKVLEGEPVFTKTRAGAFSTTDLLAYLRANCITKLVLAGVATGGVILTTVREAFDLDFELTVLSDGCADRLQDQGDALIKLVLPNQCTVCTVEEWGQL